MANAFAAAVAFSGYGHLISTFVEMLVSAGWVVRSSGDGLSGFDPAGKIFTGTTGGALGWGNPGAWARVGDPGSVREITIQHNNSGGAIIKYSQLAKFTGGTPSAGTTPTATDEKAIRGSYSPAWLVGPNSGFAYGCAKDTAPYGFWFAATNSSPVTFSTGTPGLVNWTANGITTPAATTSATVRFTTSGTLPTGLTPDTGYFAASVSANTFAVSTAIGSAGMTLSTTGTGTHTASILRLGIMMDPVVSVPEDPDPVVWLIGTDSAWLTNANSHSRFPGASTLGAPSTIVYGGTIEGAFATLSADRSTFLYVQPAAYSCGSSSNTSQAVSNTGIVANPFNGKFEALPFFWVRCQYNYQGANATQLGMKGWSTMARWTGIQRAACLDTLNNLNWIAVGCMWLPWDGVTTPLG